MAWNVFWIKSYFLHFKSTSNFRFALERMNPSLNLKKNSQFLCSWPSLHAMARQRKQYLQVWLSPSTHQGITDYGADVRIFKTCSLYSSPVHYLRLLRFHYLTFKNSAHWALYVQIIWPQMIEMIWITIDTEVAHHARAITISAYWMSLYHPRKRVGNRFSPVCLCRL